MKVMFCFDFEMREDCDARDAQIYHACMCCVVLMITFFLVRLFFDGGARRVCHGGVGFNITMISLRVVIVAIALKRLCYYEIRFSTAACRVCYIFAGYVVTCFVISVVIFGISLAAVSSAEMILVCVISILWGFFLLFAVVSTREMHF